VVRDVHGWIRPSCGAVVGSGQCAVLIRRLGSADRTGDKEDDDGKHGVTAPPKATAPEKTRAWFREFLRRKSQERRTTCDAASWRRATG
jgi:hypothetical protein